MTWGNCTLLDKISKNCFKSNENAVVHSRYLVIYSELIGKTIEIFFLAHKPGLRVQYTITIRQVAGILQNFIGEPHLLINSALVGNICIYWLTSLTISTSNKYRWKPSKLTQDARESTEMHVDILSIMISLNYDFFSVEPM